MTTRRLPGTATLAVAGAAVGVVAGAAGGALLAALLRDEPRTFSPPAPVPAVSPSYPVDPPPEVEPDPDVPSLATGLPLRTAEVGIPPFGLRLPVPAGWLRSNSSAGEWKWKVPGQPDNTYFLRVRMITGFQTRESALQDRLDALAAAAEVEDLVVESRDSEGFTVTYVTAQHRRVAMERFLSLDGRTAYAVVAVIGRERDRLGMADLVERIARRASSS